MLWGICFFPKAEDVLRSPQLHHPMLTPFFCPVASDLTNSVSHFLRALIFLRVRQAVQLSCSGFPGDPDTWEYIMVVINTIHKIFLSLPFRLMVELHFSALEGSCASFLSFPHPWKCSCDLLWPWDVERWHVALLDRSFKSLYVIHRFPFCSSCHSKACAQTEPSSAKALSDCEEQNPLLPTHVGDEAWKRNKRVIFSSTKIWELFVTVS